MAKDQSKVDATKAHRVKGAAVVLPTADKREQYLYRGAFIAPGSYTEEGLQHALDIGLIEQAPEPVDHEAAVAAAVAAAGGGAGAVEADQVPVEKWNHDRLNAFAKDNGLVIDESLNKADKVKAIADAQTAKAKADADAAAAENQQ